MEDLHWSEGMQGMLYDLHYIVTRPSTDGFIKTGMPIIISRFVEDDDEIFKVCLSYEERMKAALDGYIKMFSWRWTPETGRQSARERLLEFISGVEAVLDIGWARREIEQREYEIAVLNNKYFPLEKKEKSR